MCGEFERIRRLLVQLYPKHWQLEMFLSSPQAMLDSAVPNDLINGGGGWRVERVLREFLSQPRGRLKR